ncbi:MAG: ABC transporter permease [Firmicutes bacterium]|nr:ABC transporter permease [Bacillota bacterium]MBQ6260817.1 ABC transporter permease [Bacillota bacterium]MBR0114569.1 ABC transporter permease [Bacillota bacterium]MBR0441662.1 ABC transporter permease [Bacillota bacterium]
MAAVTVIYVVLALFADRFAPYDPVEADPAMSLCPPSAEHLFGTDKLGRDVFSRILCGAGTSFTMSFIMITFVSVLGTSIGMLCGYFGGTVDTVIMRFVDILLAFPDTVFAIAVAGMLGAGVINAVIALGLLSWTGFARMARSLTASIRERGFVEQARFNGASEVRILAKYILPNVIPQIVVMAAMRVGGTMLALASLSYLGLASQPPTPEWGVMVSESRAYMQTAPWMMIFPGLALFITVVVFNLFGDSIRDYLDIKK